MFEKSKSGVMWNNYLSFWVFFISYLYKGIDVIVCNKMYYICFIKNKDWFCYKYVMLCYLIIVYLVNNGYFYFIEREFIYKNC